MLHVLPCPYPLWHNFRHHAYRRSHILAYRRFIFLHAGPECRGLIIIVVPMLGVNSCGFVDTQEYRFCNLMQTLAGQNHIAVGENKNTSYAVNAKRLLVGKSMNISESCQTLRHFWNRQTEMTKWKALALSELLAVAVPPKASIAVASAVCISNHPSTATHSHDIAAQQPSASQPRISHASATQSHDVAALTPLQVTVLSV